MTLRRPHTLAWKCGLGGACLLTHALAQPVTPPADSSPPALSRKEAPDPLGSGQHQATTSRAEVVITLVGSPGDRRELELALSDELGALGVGVRIVGARSVDRSAIVSAPTSPGAPPLARIWLDFSAGAQVTVYVVDDAAGRVLTRELEHSREHVEVTTERVVQVVATTVDAVLRGATIGRPREEVRAELLPEVALPASDPTPAPAPTPIATRAPGAPPYRVGFTGRWRGRFLAPDTPLRHGPELGLGAVRRRAPRWGGGLSVHYGLPSNIEASPLGLRLSELAIHGTTWLDTILAPRSELRLALGPGLGVAIAEGRPAPGVVTRPVETRIDAAPEWRFELAHRWAFLPRMGVVTAVAADLALSDVSYVWRSETGSHVVLEPWPVVASVAVGVEMR